MRNIYVISDTHFNHSNILTFKNQNGQLIRPEFDTIEQMNECIADNWADTVKDGDIVYHLGDVFMTGDPNFINKLPGRKRLILGNHDDLKKIIKLGCFSKIQLFRVFREFNIILSHVPMDTNSRKNCLNVHGHIHERSMNDNNYVNVCVERTKYKPVDLESLAGQDCSQQLTLDF